MVVPLRVAQGELLGGAAGEGGDSPGDTCPVADAMAVGRSGLVALYASTRQEGMGPAALGAAVLSEGAADALREFGHAHAEFRDVEQHYDKQRGKGA